MDHFTCKLTIGNRKYGMRVMSPIDGAPFATKVIKCLSKLIDNPNVVSTLETFYSGIKDKIDIGQEVLKTKSGDISTKLENINANNVDVKDKDMMKLGLSIMSLLSNMNTDEINSIFKEAFNSDVFIENERLSDEIVFHKHFQQYANDYYPVAIWIVFNNVKPFLGSVGDGIQALFQSLKTRPAPTLRS